VSKPVIKAASASRISAAVLVELRDPKDCHDPSSHMVPRATCVADGSATERWIETRAPVRISITCTDRGTKRDFQSPAPSRPTPPVQITGPRSSKRTAWSPRLSSSDRVHADANTLSRPSSKPELPGLKPEEDRTRDDPTGISGVGIPEGDTLWDRGYTHCGTERIAETPPHRNLRLESVTP